jgi:hypothetical protein
MQTESTKDLSAYIGYKYRLYHHDNSKFHTQPDEYAVA